MGSLKKRLRPCVCNETSSRGQGKRNLKATHLKGKHPALINLYFGCTLAFSKQRVSLVPENVERIDQL